MEKEILRYEEFIQKKIKSGYSERLFKFHVEMVRNFQHERLVHMLVMLFFIGMTIGLLGVTIGLSFGGVELGFEFMVSLYLIDLFMTGLSIGYVRHYYFLENHIQGLYKYFYELEKGKA